MLANLSNIRISNMEHKRTAQCVCGGGGGGTVNDDNIQQGQHSALHSTEHSTAQGLLPLETEYCTGHVLRSV